MNGAWAFLTALPANGPLALFLYWLPMAVCAWAYTARTYRNYRTDVVARAEAETKRDEKGRYVYIPTDTLGDLIGRALVTIIPFANLLAGVFDAAPEVFGNFFRWIARVFSQPLVPKRKQP